MKKKKRSYTGYAVVTRKILDDKAFKRGSFGICLCNYDLETCKRYCHKGDIVVRTYRKAIAKSITFKIVFKHPCFEWSKRYYNPQYIKLGHLWIEWETIYSDGYEREIIYENP